MTPDSPQTLRLAFVGDVALAGDFLEATRPPAAPLTFPFLPLVPVLAGVDVMVANLEGPLGREGEPRPGVTSRIHNEREVLDWFKQFPAAICNLANNHLLDYGPTALLRTLRLLDDAGITHVGAGVDHAAASSLRVVEVGGTRLGLLGLTSAARHVGSVIAGASSPGCASLDDPAAALESVASSREKVDCLIVSLHWGHEYYHYPAPGQVDFSRRLVDAGATLVIGHHPHVQQGIEEYRHGLIAYSLGNLLLPELRLDDGRVQYRKPVTKQFAVLRVELTSRGLQNWCLLGGRCSRGYELQPYAGAARARFDAGMRALAQPLDRTDYPEFWAAYRTRREAELKRESLRDAVAKLWVTDWRTLLRTFSVADIRRNLRRLTGVVGIRKS
jgi:hypothetical protein